MGIFGNIANKLEPTFRFGGWEAMGAHVRPKDTRTPEQLLANIDYFAKHLPEIAKFKNELKTISPEHLGLASDICELGCHHEMLPTNIDIRKQQNGKSVLEFLMEKLPKASKENPEALKFTEEVINNTDTTASKYFLSSFAGVLEHPEAGKHLAATKPLVKDLAESTLNGSYSMDYSKERSFINALCQYINPNIEPEKIKVVNETLRTVEELPKSCDNLMFTINGTTILKSSTPVEKMRENLATFKQIAENLVKQVKEFNLSDFIVQNSNLH